MSNGNNKNKDQSNKEIKSSGTTLKKRASIKQEKILEVPVLKKKVVSIFCKVFLCILGDIQYRLAKYSDEKDDEFGRRGIKVPPHLKSCSHLNIGNNYNYNNNRYDSENENEEESEEKEEKEEENEINDNNNNNLIENDNIINNDDIIGNESSKKNVLRANKKEKESNNSNLNNNSNIQSTQKLNEIKNSREENILKFEEDNENNVDVNVIKNNKNMLSSSENTSIEGKSKNKEGISKNRKSENSVTDATKGKNQTPIQLENNNSFQNFNDSIFDMDDEEDDEKIHIPKFFTKDKTILQLKEFPELINVLDNNDIRLDSNNVYEQSV